MQPIAPVTIADLLAPTPLPRCKFEVYDGANWLDFCSLGGKCYVKKDGISFSLGGAGMSPDPIAATWSAEIHNEDGIFHPFHPTSQYADLFRIGREVRISVGGRYHGADRFWRRLTGYMDAPRFDHGSRSVSLSGMDRMKRLADTVLREVLDTPAYGPLHWGALATFDSKAGGGGTGAEIYAEADACEIGAGEANNVTNWAEGGSGGSTASVASTKSNYALEFTRDAPGPTAQYTHNANVGAAIAGNRYTVKFWGRISVGDNYAVLMIYQTIGGVATLIGQQNIGLNGNAWTFYSKVVSITAGGALQFRVNTGGKYATATDAVQVDNISIQIYDPNYWNHYDLPVATSRGPYYVTLNGEPLWQGDAALVENAEKKPGWSYNEETAILTLTDDLAINAGTANLKVYYYTDQSLDNVLADLLVAAGYYANRAAALAAMDYTPTGITIPRVWFEPDSTALAAVKLICGRADYRLWFDEDGVPCFKPNPTATPPPPPTGATYYVDALTGNDGNNGLSPATAWKTLSKVNAAALAPDDRVLFKRGETWAEELKPTSGGTSGHPVIFGAYGVGTPPKITGATRALDTNSKNYLTFRGLIFTDKEVLATGSTGTSLEYCLLRDSNANGFKALNAPLTALKNCLVIGARDDGVLSDGATAVIDLKNTIVVANGGGIAGQTYGGGGLNTVNGGTINYSYSNITGNGYRPDWNVRGGSGGTNNQLQVLPKMERPMKDAAFFTVTIDDTGYAYAQAAAAAIEPYGGKLTFFVIPSLIDAAGQAALAALAAAGHEIAVHSWSHADLTQSLAFDISSTNTFPTIDIDVPTTTILLWCDEVGNRVTFNWAGNKTIGDLKAAAAGKGWTINNVGTIQDALRLACLHDSAGPQYLPTNGWLDVEEPNYMFWDQEINGARDWIESLTGIKPKTMAYPFGSTHALLQTWLKDQGYEGARGTNDILQTLSDIEIYNNRNGHDLKGDGSEAQVKDRAKHYFELSKQTARMLCFYVHNTGELSPTQWGWIAQELAASGTQLQTFGSYVSAIRASHTPSGDGLTYTKTYPDVFNPHLKPASPCINAGFSVGLDEDIEGTPAPQAGTYDIGAYEFLMATPASPTFEGKDLQGCSFFQDLGTVRNRIVVEGIEQGMFATREEKKRSRLTGEASDPSSIEAYLEKTHSVKNHLFQDQASIDTMVAVLLATWKDPKHYAVLDLFANSVPLELGDTIGVKLLLQKVGEIEYYADRSAIIRDISIGGDTATYKVEIEP